MKNCYPNWGDFGSLSLARALSFVELHETERKLTYLDSKTSWAAVFRHLASLSSHSTFFFFPSTSQADFQGQLDPLVSILKFTHKPGEVYKALQLRFITRGLVCVALNP